jgi:hypothetical protein
MSRRFNVQEREAFLAGVHVGVISVDVSQEQHAPLSVPIWYEFDPTVGVSVMTVRSSRKGRAIEQVGRYALVAQRESMPYGYVSVEGPVVSVRAVEDGDFERLARRYFGKAMGAAYASTFDLTDAAWYTMTPEHWYTYTEAE